MRLRNGETWQAVRHRPVQALALMSLAAAATLLSTLAPLYSTAMAQAVSRLDVEHASVLTTSLQITSQASSDAYGRPVSALTPAELAALPPASLRRHYEPPVIGLSAHADNPIFNLSGQVAWLPRMCAHLDVFQGRCPTRAAEILVSQADLRLPGVKVGKEVLVAGITQQDGTPASTTLHVVGAYRLRPGPFWKIRDPIGKSGTPASTGVSHDDWFTPEATFSTYELPSATSSATFALDARRARVDDVLALPDEVTAFATRVRAGETQGSISVTTNLGDIADDVRTQQSQADRIVPLLMLQVVLLTLVVFWQVLAAAADQRRPDVALARLRGRGRRATTRALLRELLPVVELGVLLGGIGGILASIVVRRLLLPAAPFDLPATFWFALLAAAVCIAGLTLLTARTLARHPVDRLLRRVPPRHRWHWTVLDTVLITLATSGVIAFAVGGLGRDFALAGPALVALLAGLVLGHLVTPLAALIGRRALARGRLVRGLAALEASRRPGARRTITMLTLAAAFLVFFGNAWSIGVTNRQSVAEQVVGAPRVLTVTTLSLSSIHQALDELGTDRTGATPVVVVRPLGDSTTPSTLAVDPLSFPAIALLDGAARRLPWKDLVPGTTPAVRAVGGEIAVTADTSRLPAAAGTVQIGLQLLQSDDATVSTVSLGDLRRRPADRPTTLRSIVPCAKGCTVLGIIVSTTPGAQWHGTLHLGPIRGTSTTSWGGTGAWPIAHPAVTASIAGTSAGSGLDVTVKTSGESSLTLASGWLPDTLPAFTIGLRTPPAKDTPILIGVDRQLHPVTVVTHAGRMPTAPQHTLVVDLDVLGRGAQIDPGDQVQVWLRDATQRLQKKVTAALSRHGVTVVDTTSVAAQRSAYDDSVAAWSLTLALIIGVVTLLIALLAMGVLAVTGWRTHARDLAALQLNGIPLARLKRATVLAQSATVAVAVVVGAAAGIMASWLAIDQVPLFAHQPALTSLDLSPSWPVIIGTTIATLVVLLVAAGVLARRVAARARLERLREAS